MFALPTRAGSAEHSDETYRHWVEKYGEDNAKHLLEAMNHWTANYTHGVFVDFDFTKPLHLRERVQNICAQRGWEFEEVEGDMRLLQHWLDGEWDPESFLVLQPGQSVRPSYDDRVIESAPTEDAEAGDTP